jgi:hypothetical protein
MAELHVPNCSVALLSTEVTDKLRCHCFLFPTLLTSKTFPKPGNSVLSRVSASPDPKFLLCPVWLLDQQFGGITKNLVRHAESQAPDLLKQLHFNKIGR